MATRSLSHAELVLLALLEEGPAHAYELVQRIRSMEVERWARVAESTVYAVLRRMEERSLVDGERRPGERSKTKTTYRRTGRGDAHLRDLVRRGLRSPEPIYSDRLVAAVFGAAFGRGPEIDAALEELDERRDALDDALDNPAISEYGRIIIRFYARIADAHAEALAALGERSTAEGRERPSAVALAEPPPDG
ncbi:MAG: hypothetical protein GWM92_15335 [Gemmatimonadetes bacterium]|nr:PadR family transcriptional regulator [Gemmatimonadota bacterium]NIR80109.1 PadR family transcriptional regulator [Gemmatimonadota bacterium]NIT88864.1 PadR family transcriptional regulator [Gemmatimonadota bacterium]NIU32664.1 PadR family transcriptional regulator [Gemmatimonadota bacterium]NIU37104.1 hypothetical protein [Gemmatimonadota bacterium]